jgi:hypothetical protein
MNTIPPYQKINQLLFKVIAYRLRKLLVTFY